MLVAQFSMIMLLYLRRIHLNCLVMCLQWKLNRNKVGDRLQNDLFHNVYSV